MFSSHHEPGAITGVYTHAPLQKGLHASSTDFSHLRVMSGGAAAYIALVQSRAGSVAAAAAVGAESQCCTKSCCLGVATLLPWWLRRW
jgi:hypothetical protein